MVWCRSGYGLVMVMVWLVGDGVVGYGFVGWSWFCSLWFGFGLMFGFVLVLFGYMVWLWFGFGLNMVGFWFVFGLLVLTTDTSVAQARIQTAAPNQHHQTRKQPSIRVASV